MSTVTEGIAKDVVEGKYEEEGWAGIIAYQNMFDGGQAFKLCRTEGELNRLLHFPPPSMIAPRLYWRAGKGGVVG